MKTYIKKYSLILIILILLDALINFFVMSQLPMILINLGFELNEANDLTRNIALNYIPVLKSIIIGLVILLDLIKNKIKAIPIVLLTMFSYFAGVILFFLLLNNKINNYDK